jgi:diguanylate cyclase (GGDEF)-like protein
VAVADLDRFKQVNDRHGHLNGDLVLQRVAGELAGLLRETDFIGRFGGEEFLVVLPETGLEGARGFAEKARRRLEEVEVRLDNGARVRVTVSVGVASRSELRGDARARARNLLAAADEALYAAKNAGRNRVEVAAGLTRRRSARPKPAPATSCRCSRSRSSCRSSSSRSSRRRSCR